MKQIKLESNNVTMTLTAENLVVLNNGGSSRYFRSEDALGVLIDWVDYLVELIPADPIVVKADLRRVLSLVKEFTHV